MQLSGADTISVGAVLICSARTELLRQRIS